MDYLPHVVLDEDAQLHQLLTQIYRASEGWLVDQAGSAILTWLALDLAWLG